VTGLLNEILANPERFGITNITMSALQDPLLSDKTFDGPGKDYLFWDLIHPTSKVHAIIAERMREIIGSRARIGIRIAGAGIILLFDGLETGSSYSLQRSVDLRDWIEETTINAVSQTHERELKDGSPSHQFFRLRILE